MSYGTAAALQAAIYQRLSTDSALSALVGEAVHDGAPRGEAGGTFVSIGPGEARDASSATERGALHDFVVSVVSDAGGFMTAKAAAGAVSDALTGATLVLSRGRLVGMWFLRARALRTGKGDTRRIDLTFRARTED